ncbi:GNAT family N-acetyltransferase [Synechococcus sp. PCC 7336]|uniref:GNAT family N-acetyltransferase n=1 Tax=Synechococcus sp. PCC 7336 TaxID=195250 RepID=UPI000348B24E|nr:GNAT family N-acetyltransferase [Synechococcus sp. PCC 7336]
MTTHPSHRDPSPTSPSRPRSESPSRPAAIAVSVYPARLEQLDEIADVLARSFHPRVGVQGLVWPLLRWSIREDSRRRLQGGNPHYCCLGAWVRERLVGTLEIGLRRTSSSLLGDRQRHPYIANLAVLPHWRRQGVASQLLVGAEAVAIGWGGECIYLHVLDSNGSARSLYTRAGYSTLGRQPNPWTALGMSPQLLLYKSLKPPKSPSG